MLSTAIKEPLCAIRSGDFVTFENLVWSVTDYSTCTGTGSQTEEWLLRADSGKECWLLRESEPDEAGLQVQWYLAEQVRPPILILSSADKRKLTSQEIQLAMRNQADPYPQLQTMGRTYTLESSTEGLYHNGKTSRWRTTWDYWDSDHRWNLAFETWPDKTLDVWSTRTVNPSDFRISHEFRFGRKAQLAAAWSLVVVGFLIMFGWNLGYLSFH